MTTTAGRPGELRLRPPRNPIDPRAVPVAPVSRIQTVDTQATPGDAT